MFVSIYLFVLFQEKDDNAGGKQNLAIDFCVDVNGRKTCYAYVKNNLAFDEAGNFCKGAGGHLMTISDPSAQDRIETEMVERNYSDVWIGLSSGEQLCLFD